MGLWSWVRLAGCLSDLWDKRPLAALDLAFTWTQPEGIGSACWMPGIPERRGQGLTGSLQCNIYTLMITIPVAPTVTTSPSENFGVGEKAGVHPDSKVFGGLEVYT